MYGTSNNMSTVTGHRALDARSDSTLALVQYYFIVHRSLFCIPYYAGLTVSRINKGYRAKQYSAF